MTNVKTVRALPFDQRGLNQSTAKRIARLLRIVRDMGIDLRWENLGPTLRGHYVRDKTTTLGCDVVVMNVRLQGFQVADTLGHEIAHAMFGDTVSNAETEERARRIGAVLAIDPAEFRRARFHEDPTKTIRAQYDLPPRAFVHLVGGDVVRERCQSVCHPGGGATARVADANESGWRYP